MEEGDTEYLSSVEGENARNHSYSSLDEEDGLTDREDSPPGRMLQQAAIYNNMDLMENLLQGPEKLYVNLQDSYGRTPLYTAVTNNSLECAKLLLGAGADASMACKKQCGDMTALHRAALDNKHHMVSLLLEAGADVNKEDASNETPLTLAMANRSQDALTTIRQHIRDRGKEMDRVEQEFVAACRCGDLELATSLTSKLPREQILSAINYVPDAQNSLLHRACEAGWPGIVELLLENGAEVHVHPVTGHSPLHATCRSGSVDCATAILQRFPELIRAPTIEGIFPLHLACADGQTPLVQLFLSFPYPAAVKKLYKQLNGDKMYRLGLALNAKDGHGRTPLHTAVMHCHEATVAALLCFSVFVDMRFSDKGIQDASKGGEGGRKPDDTREVSAEGQVILSEATTNKGQENLLSPTEEYFAPVEVDIRDLDGNTPLHVAIKGNGKMGFHGIAKLLLEHKANPMRPIISPSGNSTPLLEACRMGDSKMVDLLMLKHGARDETGQVLTCAINMGHEPIIGTLLQGKSHVDNEHKVNHLAVMEGHQQRGNTRQVHASLRSLWPNTAVAVNWHQLGLRSLSISWLCKCSRQQIGRPPASAKHGQKKLSLCAITRLDLSNNSLMYLPAEIFKLPSLRVLNLASNQLQGIKYESDTQARNSQVFEARQDPLSNDNSGVVWEASTDKDSFVFDSPLLEEINLQDNQFQSLPTALFRLESLRKLNCSHNKLNVLPFEMWTSLSLVDLNLSHNKLSSLPYGGPETYSQAYLGLGEDGSVEGDNSSSGTSSQPSTPRHSTHFDQTHVSEGEVLQVNPPQGKSLQITYRSYWQKRVPLRPIGVRDFNDSQSDSTCKLLELNLSHNLFESPPIGLSCLASQLQKLVLANNKLSQIGPMENYPSSLRVLDLSYNAIVSDVLFEYSVAPDRDGSDPRGWAFKICHNPNYNLRKIGSPAGCRSSVRNSTSSLSSLASTQFTCPHRSHKCLSKLRMLYLANNKLSRLALRLAPDTNQDVEFSSGESKSRPGSGIGSQSPPASPFLQNEDLLFPSLSVLDVSHNSLTSIPSDISLLVQLAEFKVAANKQLKELPADLGLLRKLWNLNISDCAVERTLLALLGDKAKKTAAVLSYLKSIKEEATLYNRMKLMFVGVQGIGKTSLLSLLRKEGKTASVKQRSWAQRMGEEGVSDRDIRGENLSTVGVDIADLHLARSGKDIIFSTWDFGGQREYYATHQYFLSKRSLYLVVWKVTDGERGVHEILQWLVNIQARAPNSPVIIVGTHLDKVSRRSYPPTYMHDLQTLIEDRYMRVTEPEKCGLPRVLGHVEVSCKPRLMFNTHISDLVNLIWRVVSEEQLPGSRGVRLLDQKVPASYVRLEEVVGQLARQRKQQGQDPVLYAHQYKQLVKEKMDQMYSSSFRDTPELNQATQFLHDNGVLLHYDDVNLQDVYFLDPQWLCDMLASVVTIREINSLARGGIMRTDDLKVLFKNAAFRPDDIKTYIINLLNKFEVALMWDDDNLLIPSLLPHEEAVLAKLPGTDVRVPVQPYGQESFPKPLQDQLMSRSLMANSMASSSLAVPLNGTMDEPTSSENDPIITGNKNPAMALVRLYVMSYFPAGFWPRLITRLLGDEGFYKLVHGLYRLPGSIRRMAKPEWQCWQTGLQLCYLGVSVLSVKEIQKCSEVVCDYRKSKLMILAEQETDWSPLNLNSLSILELLIPNQALSIQFPFALPSGRNSPSSNDGFEGVIIQPNSQQVAALLARTVDHLDTLLEDWYPDLGARFVQNSRGMYLITRIMPCPRCLLGHSEMNGDPEDRKEEWSYVDVDPTSRSPRITRPIQIPKTPSDQEPDEESSSLRLPDSLEDILRAESAPTGDPKDEIIDTALREGRKVLHTVEGIVNPAPRRPRDRALSEPPMTIDPCQPSVYVHMVEQCLQAAQQNRIVACPRHGNLGPYFVGSIDGLLQPAHIAPDSVFQDIGDSYLVGQEAITRGAFLGKGAFGAVYAGKIQDKHTGEEVAVAIKMLHPVKPDKGCSSSLLQHYQQEKQRWDRDPVKHCCEAYLNARKELAILLALKHPYIVPLIGVSLHPLSLILSLAPLGALSEHLRDMGRLGARLHPICVAHITAQVASALSYLHACQIIYRDLKSENVLVWSLPQPFDNYDVCGTPTRVKLADYGVSRCVMPSGTKGLAGTPPFIAPEIIQHNGEEPYTEKVDCFSFGMFLYELLALKMPFDGIGTQAGGAGGANLKGYILSGGRPMLSQQELAYPAHMLDLMGLCWSHDPSERPSAREIMQLATTTQFVQLLYVMPLGVTTEVTCASSAPNAQRDTLIYVEGEEMESDELQSDVWMAVTKRDTQEASLLVYTHTPHQCQQAREVTSGGSVITCMCVTDEHVWCADTSVKVCLYSLRDYREVACFPASAKPGVHVSCMAYDKQEQQVYVVLNNGSFVVCSSVVTTEVSARSLVKTCCPGNGKPIHCISVLYTRAGSSELWCGQQQARISIWNLNSQTGNLSKVNHGDASEKTSADVVSVVTSPADSNAVWSYVYPGTIVYRWDASRRRVLATADISKHVPALNRLLWQDSKAQVTAMEVHESQLYIATTWGCMVVVNKVTMETLTTMRCHGSDSPYICAILVLPFGSAEDDDSSLPSTASANVVTIGKGYRDIILKSTEAGKHAAATSEMPDSRQMYMLTWRGDDWKSTVEVESGQY